MELNGLQASTARGNAAREHQTMLYILHTSSCHAMQKIVEVIRSYWWGTSKRRKPNQKPNPDFPKKTLAVCFLKPQSKSSFSLTFPVGWMKSEWQDTNPQTTIDCLAPAVWDEYRPQLDIDHLPQECPPMYLECGESSMSQDLS